MSREIKFRAWDTANDRMVDEPYKFHPINEYQKNTYQWTGDHVFYENWQDVDDGIDRPCFLMQFTGLKDKKAVEIFESDIVECDYGKGEVVWMLGGFWVRWIDDPEAEMEMLGLNKKFRRQREDGEQFTVIGNRYQNPELIAPQTI